jgi:hypothetical protein
MDFSKYSTEELISILAAIIERGEDQDSTHFLLEVKKRLDSLNCIVKNMVILK